jgi:ribosomal protein L37AE/L43A
LSDHEPLSREQLDLMWASIEQRINAPRRVSWWKRVRCFFGRHKDVLRVHDNGLWTCKHCGRKA